MPGTRRKVRISPRRRGRESAGIVHLVAAMLTLYDYAPSQNAWKVRQLLAHLRLPHHTRLVSIFEGEGGSDAYRAIRQTVPGEGTTMVIRFPT